jgi:hypothetical protein
MASSQSSPSKAPGKKASAKKATAEKPETAKEKGNTTPNSVEKENTPPLENPGSNASRLDHEETSAAANRAMAEGKDEEARRIQNEGDDGPVDEGDPETAKVNEAAAKDKVSAQVAENYDPANDPTVPNSVLADVIKIELVSGHSPTLQALRDNA